MKIHVNRNKQSSKSLRANIMAKRFVFSSMINLAKRQIKF